MPSNKQINGVLNLRPPPTKKPNRNNNKISPHRALKEGDEACAQPGRGVRGREIERQACTKNLQELGCLCRLEASRGVREPAGPAGVGRMLTGEKGRCLGLG